MQADDALVKPMKDRQFKQFTAEVLKHGAGAVLPQNLPDRWLNALLEEAEIFKEGDSENVEETCAGLLSAVILILSQQSGHPDQMAIPVSTLLRYMSYYIITLSGESVSRHTDI
jgi:glucose-6-phosphate isomerase